jgi:4-hydroxybenzoate polyprenyltransferase
VILHVSINWITTALTAFTECIGLGHQPDSFHHCSGTSKHQNTYRQRNMIREESKGMDAHKFTSLWENIVSSFVSLAKATTLLGPGLSWLFYHAHTLWLFNYSDLKTIVIPKTSFALIALLSNPRSPTSAPHSTLALLPRCICPSLMWTWLNLLPLSMCNQFREGDVDEDRQNKPWRPIPAGRITVTQTKYLMMASYMTAILASIYLGGLLECCALVFEGWVYNEVGAANDNLLARNLLNALGYMTFAAGAVKVACIQAETRLSSDFHLWMVLLAAVVATTIQFQDLYDQAGDRLRGRQTMPLLVGDTRTRVTIGLAVMVWSLVCPTFWRLDARGFVLQVSLAVIIVGRLYCYRTVKADKVSFKVWNVWIVALYALPFIKKIIEH